MEEQKVDRTQTDPMGNTWIIVPSKMYPGLVQIVSTGKAKTPDSMSGMYTGPDKAQAALQRHLTAMWEMSDEKAANAQKPLAKPKEKVSAPAAS